MVMLQLQPNREWLTVAPTEGSIAAGQIEELELNFLAEDEGGAWQFELGGYDGEVVFSTDGRGEQTLLPVHLEVIEWSGVVERTVETPSSGNLRAAFPNPFNSSTTISFSTGSSAHPTRLAVYALDGRLVKELENGKWKMGA